MFETLTERLESAFDKLRGKRRITETNISQSVKEIRRALLAADVHYRVAKEFTEEVKREALGQEVLKSVTPGQMLVKIVYDRLVALMGGEAAPLELKSKPAVILMAGLQGSGKTTFSAKLAKKLKSEGKKVLLAAADVYRPAAIEQLKILGEQIGVDVFAREDLKDPREIAREAMAYAKAHGHSVVIVDTAGRLSIDEEMMREIRDLRELLQPDEILFVVDAMTGQDAVNTAKAFNDVLDYTGVVLTKLDGDARGGAALTIRKVVRKPIKFVGVGEKLDDLMPFHPDRMASRILGMGDVVTLVEKAQQTISEEEARRMQKRLAENKFDFEDLLSQLRQLKKMGGLKDVLSMVPGMGKMLKNVDLSDESFKHVEAIIQSMTPVERRKPEIIDKKRKMRIAMGSGTSVQQVNQLLRQLQEMRKMMRKLNKQQGGKRPKRRKLFGRF